MGFTNPPVSWRELERRLSWNVTRLPARPEPGPEAGRPRRDPPGRRDGPAPGAEVPWAELHCHSSYSFLDGASSPAELVAEAVRQGVEALAITDHDGMYGVAQFAQAAARLAEQTGTSLGTVFGAELSVGSMTRGATPRTPRDAPRWYRPYTGRSPGLRPGFAGPVRDCLRGTRAWPRR